MSTIPYYTADDVRRALPMPRAIEVMRAAFCALGEGRVTMPVRIPLNVPDGVTLFMPAYIAPEDGAAQNAAAGGAPVKGQLGMKLVSVFTKNPARGLPVIHALVTVVDDQTGAPIALIDGTYLTRLRTGAVSGLATDFLAQPGAQVLTIIGAGGQAACQIEAVCAVRPITTVNIVSRGESAAQLAATLGAQDAGRRYHAVNNDLEGAIRAADVIVTSTGSRAPLFDGRWVKHGAHVNAIGAYRSDMREVGPELLNRADVYVDQRDAALEEAGDLLIPHGTGEWSMDAIKGELADLVLGRVVADRARTTFFKSCGLAVEDIAAAAAIVSALTGG